MVDRTDESAYRYRSDTAVSVLSGKAAGRLGIGAPTRMPGRGVWGRACRRSALILLCACGTLAPEAEIAFSQPVIQAPKFSEKDRVRVAASVLNDSQAQQSLGVDLASRDLQTVWVRIENGSQRRLWFLVAALDADYYTPNEVAFLFRNSLPQGDRARLATFLSDHSPSQAIESVQSAEGTRSTSPSSAVSTS